MESCDVLIVGGGPAGSSCAWKLHQAGASVVVLDRARFPRDKVCAGWITPQVLEELSIDVDEYSASRVFQPITGFHTSTIGGPVLETRYDRPVSFGIRRCEFDDYLLRRSGARAMLDTPLRSMRSENGEWVVNETIRSRMLVGAGGHFCPVALALNPRRRHDSVVVAREVEFRIDARARCNVTGAEPELYFCPDLQGYGWCFKKGEYLNVGFGRVDSRELASETRGFVDFLKRRQKVPHDIPVTFVGHAYRLFGSAPRVRVADGVLLVGDAAALAYPESGEGIRPAIESGIMAAEAILTAAGRYNRDRLEPYDQFLDTRFGGSIWSRALTQVVPQHLRVALATKLMNTPWFARHVLLDGSFLHAACSPLEPAWTHGRR